ncbi:hypothetical protein ATCC90586_009509 [Pythium insidiosum]|nr:hypothetical protein ATCC90586_009509 [Pythium insidiosum]
MGSSTSKALQQEALAKPLEPLPVPISIIHDTQHCIEAPTTYLVRHKYGKDESTITMWEYTDGKRAQDITFHVKSFNGVAVSYATSHGTRSFTVSNAARQQVIRAGCVGHADFAIKDASASRHDAPICMLKRSIAKWEPVIVGQVRNRSTGHIEKTPEIRRPIARTVAWGENDMRLAYQLEVTSGVDILALISMITVLDVSDEALSSDVFAQ